VKLIRVDTVALGAFNPAIPTPAWYVRLGVIAPTIPITTEFQFGGGAPRYFGGGIRWAVLPDQFISELLAHPPGNTAGPLTPSLSDDDVARPGDFLARTLEHLPHTPLLAVGNNFAFELEGEPSDRWRAFIEASSGIANTLGAVATATVAQIVLDNAIRGAAVTLGFNFAPRMGVSFNVHRLAGTAEEATAAARQAANDFAWARGAIGKLTTSSRPT
jgi:hypothetical protein